MHELPGLPELLPAGRDFALISRNFRPWVTRVGLLTSDVFEPIQGFEDVANLLQGDYRPDAMLHRLVKRRYNNF
jgi:hypothetical protein